MRFLDAFYTVNTFNKDTTWLNVGDTNDIHYQLYYTNALSTNMGKFCTIAKSYETNDTTTLRSANTALNTSVCHFSKGLQDVNQVFLDTWAAENYELSTQQTQLMEDLACSDALVNGPAVYGARAILGVFFECSNGYQKSAVVGSEPTEQEGTALKEDVTVLVYPNPSQGEVYLNYFLGERTNTMVQVFDIAGKLIYQLSLENSQGIVEINRQLLHSGAYFYIITENNEKLATGKFIIE